MTCIELIERIAKKYRMSKVRATLVVETIFGCLEKSLRQGCRSEIRGLGTFAIRSYRGYRGRNPKTGEQIEVRPKRLPYFKASIRLLRKMNGSLRDVSVYPEAKAVEPGSGLSESLRELSST